MLKNNFHNPQNQGFSLIEIIIVLVIAGTIAALAFPRYNTIMEKARSHEGDQILYAILAAQKRFFIDNRNTPPTYATSPADQLDIEFRTTPNFGLPTYANTATLGTITRNGGLYTLTIDVDGVIRCSPSAGLCARMGYPR